MSEVINTNAVFDSTKKFVDFEGLDYFWGQAKKHIDNADSVLSGRLDVAEGNISDLKIAVGDEKSGLTQAVASLRADVDALGGTEGGIQGMIDASIEALDLPNTYDAKGAAADALDAAKAYTNEVVGAYTDDAEGVEASGLRKEIEDHVFDLRSEISNVEAAAKSYSIVKVTEGLSENVKEAFKLVDEDNVQAGETINIYKDSSLKSVKLEGQELVFVYILANGQDSDPVKVDVSAFLSESEYGNGLQVVDHIISVKKDAESEAFLSVSENGIKVSGVQEAINTAAGTVEAMVSGLANGAVKANTEAIAIINGDDTVEGSIAKAKADAIAAAQAKIDELDVANTYETKSDAAAKLAEAKAYTDSAIGVYSSEAEGIVASGLRKEIEDNEKVTSGALNDLNDRVEVLEAQDVYVAKDVADAIDTAQAAAEAYAATYTNALFDSIKFASETDIDSLFAVEEDENA